MEVINNVGYDVWDDIVDNSPNSTFYHTRTWASIIEASFKNCKVNPRLYRFSDSVEALLIVYEYPVMKGFMNIRMASFPSIHGGPISKTVLHKSHIDAVLKSLQENDIAKVAVFNNPFDRFAPSSGFKIVNEFTHILSLEDGYEKVYSERFINSTRRNIIRAQNKGVTVLISQENSHINRVCSLYEMSIKRWGDKTTWMRPTLFCENSMRFGASNIKLRVAIYKDIIIGGAIDYYHKDVCYAGWRAFDYDYREFSPNNLLINDIVKDACEQGYKYYDFGASSGLAGVAEFKERCGAVAMPYEAFIWENPLYTSYVSIRRNIRNAKNKVLSMAR